MKNGDVLLYCRTRLKALGRTEHTATFNYENTPRTRLATMFHVELGTTNGVSNNQDNQVGNVPVTVRIPFAPAREVMPIRDAAVVFADTVIADFLNPRNRLTQANSLKNVAFDSMNIEPLAESNDNGVVVVLGFSMLVITSTR